MSKLGEIVKKFGVARNNGVPEQLKEAQRRIENIEAKAMEALERMKNSRSAVINGRTECACGSVKK